MMTIKDILLLNTLKGSYVLSGKKGLTREVREMAVMEVPDVDDYLKPYDFLLTTLYAVCNSEKEQQDLIKRLNALGVSGIGIKLNRYVKEVSEETIKTAERLNFPLIILPEDSNFSHQITDCLKHSLRLQNQELTFRGELHRKLMEVMLSEKDYSELCDELSTILGRNVVILDAEKSVIGCSYQLTGNEKWQEILPKTRLSSLYYRTGEFCVYTVRDGKNIIGYIAVSIKQGELTVLEKIAVEEFAVALGIIYHSKSAVERTEMHYFNEFANDLLMREMEHNSSVQSRASALGFKSGVTVSILVLQLDRLPAGFDGRASFYEHLRRRLTPKGIMLAHVEQYAVMFVERKDEAEFERSMQFMLETLHAIHAAKYYMGVSHKINDLSGYRFGYQEAKSAMAIAQWLQQDRVMYSENTGVYRIIHACKNKEELIQFSNSLLAEVVKYDKANNAELLGTLRELIEHGGNLKETAEALFIHYNTARYRKRLLCQLTGKELQSFSDLSDLNMALKIHFLFSK